jgi:hypothetical protein
MSKHVAARKLKHISATVGATISSVGAVAVLAIVLPIGNTHATASTPGSSPVPTSAPAPTPTVSADENPWG